MARDFEIKIDPDFQSIKLELIEFNQDALDAIYYRLVQGGNRIRNKMINKMRRTPKTGRKYKRGRKWHIASSPGNAPAVDSGQLIRSITMNETRDSVEVGVKSGAPYAKYLESGAPKRKLLPRPFLKPSADTEIPRIKRDIIADLRKMIA